MSNRSLFEINHDFWMRLDDPEFLAALHRYLASADHKTAAGLERFGIRVLGMRHHSGSFVIKGDAEGFPPVYLDPPKPKRDDHEC